MGKAQRVRDKKRRQNMTGLASVAQMEAEAKANEPLVEEGPKVPLLKKIDDPVASHRAEAFRALSNLVIDDPETKQALSKKENIKKVVARVLDPELDVRVAAIGTLRNMTQFGEPNVSDDLVRYDIFTPITAVVQQILATPPANIESAHQMLTQSVGLLLNLCENSERALELFSASKMLPFFAQFLQPKVYPYDLVITTGQFFFLLTDNNTRAQRELASIEGYLPASKALIQDPQTPLRIRILLAGIDANIFASSDPAAFNTHAHVWELLFQSLDCDWSVETQKLFAKLETVDGEVLVKAVHSNEAIIVDEMPTAQEKQEKERRKAEAKTENKNMEDEVEVEETTPAQPVSEAELKQNEEAKQLQSELENFQENIKAQKLALEILTNICSDEYQESPESMDDDAMGDDEEGEYDEQGVGASASAPENPDLAARSSALWKSGLFPRVLQLSYPARITPQNRVLEGSEWLYLTLKYISEVQERAVGCIGNMLLDAGAKTNLRDPNKVWETLVIICAQSGQNVGLLESATSGMWTLLRTFNANGATILTPSNEHITGILQLAKSTGDEYANLRSAAVGMLGVIAQQPNFKPALKDIGRVFLECLVSPNATVVAEALNSIFDVFAEPVNNDVVRALDLMTILKNFLPHLKNKVKNDKRVLSRDVWDRLDESRINLVRFIKYKKNQ